jgi:hypothetical protein
MRAKMPISRRPSSRLCSTRSATRSSIWVNSPILDRGAERARAQLEVELLVAVARERLPVADDQEVEPHQRERDQVGHAQQPGVAEPDGAHHVELAGRGELAEREQDAEHDPERDRQAGVLGDQVDEHLEDDRHRPALGRDELHQPQHLLEHEQRGGEREHAEHRHEHEPEHVAVDGGEEAQVRSTARADVRFARL